MSIGAGFLLYSRRMRLLSIDDRFLEKSVLRDQAKKLVAAKAKLLADWKSGRQGWLGTPDDKELVARGSSLVARKKQFTTCLVIGIGGSDLGARAVWHALKGRARGMNLEFAGGNTDPDELEATFSRIDWKHTLVNVISKSGDTLEPMAAFYVVRDILKKKIGIRFGDHIVATTDARRSALRDLAMREGYALLDVPENIGGRFSVLTNVGLFPMACAGFDVEAMLRGAQSVRDDMTSASRYAAALVAHHKTRGRNIHVLMPYSERLRLFGTWYRQIWAESLGKSKTSGPTPVAALGATDQHSQIQLYMDGPDDKIVTFIEVEKFASKLNVPSRFFGGASFEKIVHAERAGTAAALASRKRPNATITIPRVNEESLGALFMFFMIATGIAGELYGIDTYDQPGVEDGKKRMRTLLNM